MYNIVMKMEFFEKHISIFIFLAMLLVLTIQIISRHFINFAIPWTEELSRWFYIYIVFVGASEAVSRRDHIAVDIVQNRLSNKFNLVLDTSIHIVFSLVSAFIAYRGYLFAERMDRLTSVTMDIQMSMLYVAVPIGFALVFIKSVANAYISISKLLKRETRNLALTSHICK